MIIGLDCAPPALVFDRLLSRLPNLASLMRRGAHGPLRSVAPPITVPAWACMVSGRDPGELGLYGFRNRIPGDYALSVSDARALEVPRIWDVLSEAGRTVATLYVPLTSPPRPVNGVMVSCFLGEDGAPFTHPPELGAQLEALHGEHTPDVSVFRTDDLAGLLDELYDTARQHFAVARQVWVERHPELMMMVEMGTDRLHHAMWRHLDPSHPDHDPSDPMVREASDYYAYLDAEVGGLLELADEETAVLVVSDHGARTMQGGLRVNEWLRQQGWLVLKEEPDAPGPLSLDMVDWSRTRAWAAGGYYARVFLNVKGREPEGIVEDREATVRELAAALGSIPGPDGTPLGVDARRPEAMYREVRGFPPDLMVFLGDLDWRALGSVGGPLHTAGDDRGPDGCNHDWDGIFIAAGAGVEARGALEGLSIHDVGPTALALLGEPTPEGWLGVDRSGG